MAEKQEPSAGIPWLPLITLIGVGTGVLLFFPQLTSSRPGGGDRHLSETKFDEQTINARLWQDPLGVANADAEKHEKLRDSNDKYHSELHSVTNFQELLVHKCFAESANIPLVHSAIYPLEEKLRFEKQEPKLQILAVMIPGGPYIEDVERRLRARLAVIEGLQMAHYVPEKADEIGYFYVPWQPLASTVVDSVRALETNRMKDEDSRRAEGEESGFPIKREIQPARRCPRDPDTPRLLIPYEWCELSSFAAEKRPVEHVLVLWLTDDVFFDAPVARLADLFSWFRLKLSCASQASDNLPLPAFTVLGPDNSGTLHRMVLEAADNPWNDDTRQCLATTHIYSSQAAAAESQLLSGIYPTDKAPIPFRYKCKDLIERNVKGLHADSGFCFDRTIFDDDQIVDTFRQELERRGVSIANNDHIAIISEEDTYYSQALCAAFRPDSSRHIHFYTYLRGIDGKLPSDAEDERPGKSGAENDEKSAQPSTRPSAPADRPEGRNQADYLRRLATTLQDLDRELRNRKPEYKPSEGLKAIGLLGSDVYDKLELLKALRPVFPQAVFFTNNLEARLAHADEWSEAHNLVVVSARDLSLIDPDQIVQRVPPFRDSGQTALFEATLEALGRIHFGDKYIPKTPLIFEIAHDRPVKLNPATDESDFIAAYFESLKRYALAIGGFIALGSFLLTWIWLVSRAPLTSSTRKGHPTDKNTTVVKVNGNYVEAI
jgi:hypothetical protein